MVQILVGAFGGPRPTGTTLRAVLPLVLIFIVVPLAELFVIIEVGQWIGVWPTIALLFLDSILGAMLLRHQGRAAWLRFNGALAERRIPHREVFDGALIIFGGALLLTPGFITDVVGLALLLPPTRAAIRRGLGALFRRRMAMGERVIYWSVGPRGGAGRPGAGRPPAGYDYEGTAREVPDEQELPPRSERDGAR
jgi:UPF0716 protein FxsA